ncbi:MAG: hypothetical protein Q8M92_01340, partial [Candidatus Subteraquimicrobiales bacterium]|nr:hypothetical protein [Candidatus Subteraquimicrobiales bacterium]
FFHKYKPHLSANFSIHTFINFCKMSIMKYKEFAAKPSKARSSAKSGTKNLKSSNPKGMIKIRGFMYEKFAAYL